MTYHNAESKVFKCPHCKDSRWILYEKRAGDAVGEDGKPVYPGEQYTIPYAKPCRYCMGDDRRRTLFKESGIPFQYSVNQNKFDWNAYGFEDVERKKQAAINYVSNFEDVKNGGVGLYLWSHKNGTGKTSLACSIGNALLNKSVSVKYLPAVEILDAASGGILNEYEKCDVLILDDIGKKRTGAEFYEETLLKLIDTRYTRKVCTIFTSNLPLDALEIDPAVFSRVKARVLCIEMPEIDIRGAEDESAKEILLRL